MKDWFFYQERGRTVGPVGIDDLKARINEGRIRLFDLVYRDGDSGWKMAMENPDLRGEFKSVSLDTLKDRPWVVLQKKTSVAMDFITLGPFAEKEVRESILAGRIAYSDYIWRDGFTQWRRIATLEEFNPRVKEQAQVPATAMPQAQRRELLDSVVEMKRPSRAVPEKTPREAKGPDLAASFATIEQALEAPKDLPVEMPGDIPESMAVAPPPPPAVPSPETRAPRERKAWIDWSIVAVLMLALAGTAYFIYRRALGNPVPEPAQPVAQIPLAPPPYPARPNPAEAVDTPAVEEPPAVQAQAPKVAPTKLVLNVDVKGGQARMEIRSNGSADFPVYVQIVGLPGQVSEGASYYKYLKMSPSGDQPLDLSSVRLPQGKFILRAETGDLRKEARFSLGTGDPQYKSLVARQRKMHAQAIWSERLKLFKVADKLEKELDAFLSGAKFKGKGYEALGAVRRGNSAGLILFEDWYELKQILAEAKEKPSEALYTRAKRARERMASFSVWK